MFYLFRDFAKEMSDAHLLMGDNSYVSSKVFYLRQRLATVSKKECAKRRKNNATMLMANKIFDPLPSMKTKIPVYLGIINILQGVNVWITGAETTKKNSFPRISELTFQIKVQRYKE
jgi:hypothetical protein